MGETDEVQEISEKQITKSSEKKIETFDALRTEEKSERIYIFDDIREQGSDRPIKTFDDLRGRNGEMERVERSLNESPEEIERKRIKQAAENIKKIDSMKPEKWKTLNPDEKEWALRHCGKALRDAYHTPDPPLLTYRGEPNELGEYGDGWSYNKTALFDRDYGIRMNEEGIKETKEKLFGDDPKAALETYAHEFRHSYQCEQAHAFDQSLMADDPIKAKEWSGNLGKNYKEAPSSELAKMNPEEYSVKYEAYKNQPVEVDARDFASKIVSEVYE